MILILSLLRSANLLAQVKRFMDNVSPFPGNGYGTAKM
jgi:hypothetical protein